MDLKRSRTKNLLDYQATLSTFCHLYFQGCSKRGGVGRGGAGWDRAGWDGAGEEGDTSPIFFLSQQMKHQRYFNKSWSRINIQSANLELWVCRLQMYHVSKHWRFAHCILFTERAAVYQSLLSRPACTRGVLFSVTDELISKTRIPIPCPVKKDRLGSWQFFLYYLL